MSNKKITEIELNAIKKISSNAAIGEWFYDEFNNEIRCGEYLIVRDMDYAADAEFIAASRQDILNLVSEVEILRAAINNAISLLPYGENRLANRHLCEALGVDDDHYGFFSGGDDD